MKTFIVFMFVLIAVGQVSRAAETPAVLINKIDPNQGMSRVGVVFDSAEVELTVDQTGKPFAIQASEGLPDYVVKALEQWRYSPFKKNGHDVPFSSRMTIPIARALTPAIEKSLAPTWFPSDEVRQAIKRGRELSQATADELEAHLPEGEALGNPRTSLLVYYSNQNTSDLAKARAARARILEWLVEHYPEDEILGSHLAIVNSSGDPLADPSTSTELTKLWVKALAEYPMNEKIRVHALNFLQVASPRDAMQVLANHPAWKDAPAWTGDIFGLVAAMVTTLSPETGKALATSEVSAPFNEAARQRLLKSENTKTVLVGLLTVRAAGGSLAAAGHLPPDYQAFCETLLAHAKELYPQTAQSCDTDVPGQNDDSAIVNTSGKKVTPARLLSKIQPVYPSKAKDQRVQGTVIFSAFINAAGEIEELGLKSGPFLLYSAAAEAVRQWRYEPTRLDGKPVPVTTTIDVNFNLGR